MSSLFDIATILSICGGVAAIGAAFAVVVAGLRATHRWFKKIRDLYVDVNGIPDRPGVPGLRPLRECIAEIQTTVSHMDERVATIESEIKHNGGSTIKDVVHVMDEKIDTLVANTNS